jgi:hypothetical protein
MILHSAASRVSVLLHPRRHHVSTARPLRRSRSPRTQWTWLLVITSVTACLCAADSNKASAKSVDSQVIVSFPHARAGYIVSVARGTLERRYIDELVRYVSECTGQAAVLVASLEQVPAGTPAIVIQREVGGTVSAQKTDEDFTISNRETGRRSLLVAAAREDNGIRRAIQRIIITSEQGPDALRFPIASGSYSPWIAQREIEPVTESPTWVRASFTNPAPDPRVDYTHYTDRQLRRYFAMCDWFGYNGVRIEDGGWLWAMLGSIEEGHSFVKRVAAAAAENSMSRTLHVLYADFSDFGWVDPTIKYLPAPGMTAATDPAVRASFEKYYDRYAELAPYIDRVGGHLFDPGHLTRTSEALFYTRMLIDKMRARNPRLKADVVFWDANPKVIEQLVSSDLKGVDILLSNQPSWWKPAAQQDLHRLVKRLGHNLGYWSWYITEMEPDERPSMYVNAQLLKSEFSRVRRDVDQVYHPIYWSEMDGYHVLNLFSLYVSSQLQWNPDSDPHALLMEVATGIWGPVNGKKLFDILGLIEDVRTGPTWESYKHKTGGEMELGTDDAERDLQRARTALQIVPTLAPDPGFVSKFPLPFAPEEITELMRSQLQQIADYAEFRVELAKIRAKATTTSKPALTAAIEAIWRPVPEYNTWIGTGGTVEMAAQYRQLRKAENAYGITIPDPDWLTARNAKRLLESLEQRQKYSMVAVSWPMDAEKVAGCYTDQYIRDAFVSVQGKGHRSLTVWQGAVNLLSKLGEIEGVSDAEGARFHLTHWRDYAMKPQAGVGGPQTQDLCNDEPTQELPDVILDLPAHTQ